MTARTRAALKLLFETGDKPSGANFADLIDSAVNLQDSATQVFVSNIQAPGITTSTLTVSALFATNLTVQGAVDISALNATVVSAQTLNAGTLNAIVLSATLISAGTVTVAGTLVANVPTASTVTAQVVRASAVHHKNAHALVYGVATNSDTRAGASAYAFISALLSSSPQGMVGFTHDGFANITYIGGVTAAMLVRYSLQLTQASAAASMAIGLFHDDVLVPESRSTGTLTSNPTNQFSGGAIVKMKTSGKLFLAAKISSHSTYDMTIFSYNLSIVPVSFEF